MKTNLLKVAFVAAIALVGGVNVFNAQKANNLSDIILANVEALASNARWCPDCGTCTGEFWICESDYEGWWNDMHRNCSAIDVDLNLVPGC